MTRRDVVVVLASAVLTACGGQVGDVALPVEAWTPQVLDAQRPLSAAPSFADEQGGGLFVDPAGQVVRLRADASQAPLESHPRNTVVPGPASSAWALGPSSAVVDTSRGLFVAQQGWLIEAAWRDALPAGGLVATALSADGAAWLAHQAGVFQLAQGTLQELKVDGASLTGVTALAAAPAPDGADAVWVAQGNAVLVASQVTGAGFVVRDSGLDKKELAAGIQGLAGLSATADARGEVLVASGRLLHRFDGRRWTRWTLPQPAQSVRSAGRFAWVAAGDALYRYDADGPRWQRVDGLPATATLLACDASGTAWVRVGEATLALSTGQTPRVTGLAAGEHLFGPEHALQVVLPVAAQPTAVTWHFDGDAEHEAGAASRWTGAAPLTAFDFFALGGLDALGTPQPLSLSALGDGAHTLIVTGHADGGVATTRALHFSLTLGAGAEVSWARDVKPLSEARCAKCHSAGTQPDLSTFEAWKANGVAVAAAVKEKRMPADGPLDAAGVALVQRWVNGGMLP